MSAESAESPGASRTRSQHASLNTKTQRTSKKQNKNLTEFSNIQQLVNDPDKKKNTTEPTENKVEKPTAQQGVSKDQLTPVTKDNTRDGQTDKNKQQHKSQRKAKTKHQAKQETASISVNIKKGQQDTIGTVTQQEIKKAAETFKQAVQKGVSQGKKPFQPMLQQQQQFQSFQKQSPQQYFQQPFQFEAGNGDNQEVPIFQLKKQHSQLDAFLVQKLNNVFSSIENFEDEQPSFFDGNDFLSYNVDFQLWKGYKNIKDLIEFSDFCELVFKKILLSIPQHLTNFLKGGLYNSGKGAYNKEFCTYRYLVHTRNQNLDKARELTDFLLKGVNISVYGQQIHVPAVRAPTNSLYRLKVIKLTHFNQEFVNPQFGQWFFDNILKSLQGFQNSECFIMWNREVRCKQFRQPDFSSLYLIVSKVNDKYNCLRNTIFQSNLNEGSLLQFEQNNFAQNRILVTEFYEFLKWPEFFRTILNDNEADISDNSDTDMTSDSDIDDGNNSVNNTNFKSTNNNNTKENIDIDKDIKQKNANWIDFQNKMEVEGVEDNFQNKNALIQTFQFRQKSWADLMSDEDSDSTSNSLLLESAFGRASNFAKISSKTQPHYLRSTPHFSKQSQILKDDSCFQHLP